MLVKIKKNFGKLYIGLLDQTLGRIEGKIAKRQKQPIFPPIFIIGHPRSGTTLLYQIMCSHFELVYFSNISAKILYPVICTSSLKNLHICDPRPTYTSRYGFSSGWNQPHPGYFFWRRIFLGVDGEMSTNTINDDASQQLIGTIATLTNLYERPFINKWTPNSARILELSRHFPNAIFILMRRDPRYVIQSQLKARIATRGNANTAFVTWPKELQARKTGDYLLDIVTQLKLVETEISKNLTKLGKERVIELSYSDLCDSPLKQIELICGFYNKHSGHKIKMRNVKILPDNFIQSNSIKVAVDDFERISKLLQETGLV